MATLALGFAKVSTEQLRKLPTTVRPKIDARDVQLPEGYSVEVVMAGLSFPCGLAVAEDGTVFIAGRRYHLANTALAAIAATAIEIERRSRCARYRRGGWTSWTLR